MWSFYTTLGGDLRQFVVAMPPHPSSSTTHKLFIACANADLNDASVCGLWLAFIGDIALHE
jgi:hypothetical protein